MCKFDSSVVMANVDFLHEFSRIVDAFKAQHDGCLVPAVIPLKFVLSVDQRKWFGKFFRKQAHKDWLEHVCHMPLLSASHQDPCLVISANSSVALTDTAALKGLDEFYSRRPAFAASASMPSAAIAAAPPVIDDCPPSPSIAHQPAASVAPCASQPVSNLDV